MKNLLFIIFILLLQSCATTPINPYTNWYEKNKDIDVYLPPSEDAELIKINAENVEIVRNELLTQGYQIIGGSSFNWDLKDTQLAVDHAKSIGAEKVIVFSDFTDTNTYTSGVVSYGFGVAPVTSSQRRFDQNAIYFAKDIVKLKYGSYFRPLTVEEKESNEINYGIKVFVVVNNLPFFKAGIIPGDIILEKNGRKILTFDDFFDEDNVANIKIMRNSVIKEFTIYPNVIE
tara:strand:+ start:468 stop:1160 length:693 start_codon:yes stop_codon:yes gene_type:complete